MIMRHLLLATTTAACALLSSGAFACARADEMPARTPAQHVSHQADRHVAAATTAQPARAKTSQDQQVAFLFR
jgi:hypothetical protein